jgi:hypothetical protein
MIRAEKLQVGQPNGGRSDDQRPSIQCRGDNKGRVVKCGVIGGVEN